MTTNRVCGIDPGLKGSVAFIIDGAPVCYTMPTVQNGKGQSVDASELANIFTAHEPDIVFVEHAAAMPKQGTVSMFNYGQGFGAILGVLAALRIPHKLVKPQVWQKNMCPGAGDPKGRALAAVTRLFPGVDLRHGGRKPHDGIVDALLICEYGRRIINKF